MLLLVHFILQELPKWFSIKTGEKISD